MKSFKSILCASLLTVALSSASFAGQISGRSGQISGAPDQISGQISGLPGQISGLLGDIIVALLVP